MYAGVWDPSRWWRHSLDEQTRSQSSMDDGSGSGSDTPEPSLPELRPQVRLQVSDPSPSSNLDDQTLLPLSLEISDHEVPAVARVDTSVLSKVAMTFSRICKQNPNTLTISEESQPAQPASCSGCLITWPCNRKE